jgi:hypothetical protein
MTRTSLPARDVPSFRTRSFREASGNGTTSADHSSHDGSTSTTTHRCPAGVQREVYSLRDFDVERVFGEGRNWRIAAACCSWSGEPVLLQTYGASRAARRSRQQVPEAGPVLRSTIRCSRTAMPPACDAPALHPRQHQRETSPESWQRP